MKHKGQSLSEYSLLIAIVLVTLIAMNVYVKRGLLGRYRDLVDFTARTATAQRQYEPYYVESQYTTTMQSETEEQLRLGGSVRKDLPRGRNYMASSGRSIENAKVEGSTPIR